MIIDRAPIPVTHERAREQYQRYLTLVAPLERFWHPREVTYLFHKPKSFETFMRLSQMVIVEALP